MKVFTIFLFSLLSIITIGLLCTSCQKDSTPSSTYVPIAFDPEYVLVFPDDATIKSGDSQEYTLILYNSDGVSVDATIQALFSIEKDAHITLNRINAAN